MDGSTGMMEPFDGVSWLSLLGSSHDDRKCLITMVNDFFFRPPKCV